MLPKGFIKNTILIVVAFIVLLLGATYLLFRYKRFYDLPIIDQLGNKPEAIEGVDMKVLRLLDPAGVPLPFYIELLEPSPLFQKIEVSGYILDFSKEGDYYFLIVGLPHNSSLKKLKLNMGFADSQLSVYFANNNVMGEEREWQIVKLSDLESKLVPGNQTLVTFDTWVNVGDINCGGKVNCEQNKQIYNMGLPGNSFLFELAAESESKRVELSLLPDVLEAGPVSQIIIKE